MDDAAELQELGEFIQARFEIAPTGGRALKAFRLALREELSERKVRSAGAKLLIKALINKIDAELRVEELKLKLILSQVIFIVALLLLSLVIPHIDASWADATGRSSLF